MAAIPILVYDKGFVSIEVGALYNPPLEILSGPQKAFYSQVKPGWSRCPLGYGVYCGIDDLGRKLVIPGIYLLDDKAPSRKFPDYPLKFKRSQIELFAKSHLSRVSEVRDQVNIEFKNLTHDLRAIGNEIYHGALAAREAVAGGMRLVVDEKIALIINSQQMLSLRLDIIDYESGLSSGRPKELIEPFPKVEKVLKSFSGRFSARKMGYKIDGRTRARIYGPPIFELVPFILVENALKYAPAFSDVVIRYNEEEGKTIIRFDSLGPQITNKEKEKIFDRDFRGEAAKNSQKSGSGIGLFAAKVITENLFDGKIFVNQFEQISIIGGIEYFQTRFTLVLPSSDDGNQYRR